MVRFESLPEADREDYLSALYLTMIRLGDPTREGLEGTGLHPADIDRATQVLVERGLVIRVDQGRWGVLPPETAMVGQAVRLEDRARLTRRAATELGMIWRRARGGEEESGLPAGLELLGSVEQVVLTALSLVGSAEQQLRILLDGSPASRELLLEHSEPGIPELPASSVSMVVDVAMFDHDDVLPVLEEASNRGRRIRVADGVPFGAVVVDNRVGLVDLTRHDERGEGSLVVRRRSAVSALAALFEVAYELATPVAPTLARAAGQQEEAPLEPRDLRILSLLATGASDQQIARHVGVSTRTVERRVAALMRLLGAATRFQAGVQAARRDWIVGPA